MSSKARSFLPAARCAAGVGWECVMDLHQCQSGRLDDLGWIRESMLEAALVAEATVLTEKFHRFAPHGISGVVVIGESHLAVHTWPERNFAAIDVFTCNAALKMKAAADFLIARFRSQRPRSLCIARGDDASDTDGPGAPGGTQPEASFTAAECANPDWDELYIDHDCPSGGHWFIRSGTIASRETAFQKVEIVELVQFGRALLLDGSLQSVESDEYIYHEALVQPALCLHPSPRRILIVGGGEGAAAREALKHSSVERVVMVDIDGELVALARRHLQAWHQGAFDDSRLDLIIADGLDFVRTTGERFDVIVLDLVDSAEGGPAQKLYTPQFYAAAKQRLAEGGILVVQAMECHAGGLGEHARVRENLNGLFAFSRSYATFLPSFWSNWGFVIASDTIDAPAAKSTTIDDTITARGLSRELRFYDGQTHEGLFALTRDVRSLLSGS